MNALFFGSIGTLADTSELQREAFNAAFREHGLDWHWDRDAYRDMLRTSGGQARIEAQAGSEGLAVDAGAVHATKSRLFQEMLDAGRAEMRPGLRETLDHAARDGLPVAFVTTTSRGNVDALLAALKLNPRQFALVTSRADVDASKPDPECYRFAAKQLSLDPAGCIAIEDNSDGVRAALAAGCETLAWPNENTQGHDFTGARVITGDIHEAIWAPTVPGR